MNKIEITSDLIKGNDIYNYGKGTIFKIVNVPKEVLIDDPKLLGEIIMLVEDVLTSDLRFVSLISGELWVNKHESLDIFDYQLIKGVKIN